MADLTNLPTREKFRQALRLAQREYLSRHPPRYLNDDQADADMAETATELADCYQAQIDALGVLPSSNDQPKEQK